MRRFGCLSLLALTVAACGIDPTAPSAHAVPAHALTARDGAGRYIVTLRAGVPRDVAASVRATPDHVYTRVLNGFAATMTDAQVNALRSNPRVAAVEPDGIVQAFDTQASPPAWGIDRIDQRTLPLSGSYTYPASAGAGVHVYETDTGINTTHIEFEGRADMVPVDFTAGPNGENDGWVFNDCNGHGTHVAGIVGGATVGVAKRVWLHGLRVIGCSGQGSWTAFLAALDWVVTNAQRPAIVTASLGGYFAPAAIDSAVEATVAAGIPVVVAAGNASTGGDACQIAPASAPNAITVMAIGSDDSRAFFSMYGPCTDLYAPGYLIYSAYWSPFNNGGSICNTCYAVLSGTSMATPHVTGAAALLLADNPTWTPAQLTTAILSTATPDVITGNPANTPNLLLFTTQGAAPTPPPEPPPPPPVECPPGTRPRGNSGKCK